MKRSHGSTTQVPRLIDRAYLIAYSAATALAALAISVGAVLAKASLDSVLYNLSRNASALNSQTNTPYSANVKRLLQRKPLWSYEFRDFIADYDLVKELKRQAAYELEQSGINPEEELSQETLEAILNKAMPFIEAKFGPYRHVNKPEIGLNEKIEGDGDYFRSNNQASIHPRVKLSEAYLDVLHEAVHAQYTSNEVFSETLAMELLAQQALSGDLLAKYQLFTKLERTLLNMSFESAFNNRQIDSWLIAIRARGVQPDIDVKLATVQTQNWAYYGKGPLMHALRAINGERLEIELPFEMAIHDFLSGTHHEQTLPLDGLHRFGGLITGYRQKSEFANYHFVRANELRKSGNYAAAEPLLEIVADLSQQLGENSDAFKRQALRAAYYLAETHARRGDLSAARGLLMQLDPEDLKHASIETDKTLMALTDVDPKKFAEAAARIEQQYLDEFKQRYTLDDALNDYSMLRRLRTEAEEELRRSGINPYQPVTQQRTLDEQLEKALPYVWAEFPSQTPNARPRITFMAPNEFLSDKTAKEAIGRRLQVMPSRSGGLLELRINPSIPLHDLPDAVSYGAAQLQAAASGEPYYGVHSQLISLEALANRAKDGDLLAKHELLMELEFAAWELSGTIANEAGTPHIWADTVDKGHSIESQRFLDTAKTGHAQEYEIKPYFQVMRMLRGDTAGGFRFNSERIELDGLAAYLPGLTGRLPALPVR